MADKSLKIVVTGDASSAEAAFKKLQISANEAGLSVDRMGISATGAHGKTKELGSVAEETGKKFQSDLKNRLEDITGTLTSRFGPAAGVAQTALQTVGEKALGASTGIKLAAGAAIVGGVGLLALGDEALKGAQKYVELTDQVRQFERASGASAEESSKLVYAAKELGVNAESASAGLFKMSRVDPSKLAAMGVEVQRNADGTENLTGTLGRVSEAWQRTEDPVQRNLILFTAFGKAGQNMTPLLAASTEQLKKFGDEAAKNHQVFSQSDLDKAHEYELATKNLHASFEGLQLELGKAVIPVMTEMATSVSSAITDMDHWTTSISSAANHSGVLHDVLKETSDPIGILTGSINDNSNHVSAWGGVIAELKNPMGGMAAWAGNLASQQSTTAQETAKTTEALAQYSQKMDESSGFSGKMSAAQQGVATDVENMGAQIGITGDGLRGFAIDQGILDESTGKLSTSYTDLGKTLTAMVSPSTAYKTTLSDNQKAAADNVTKEQAASQASIDTTNKEYAAKIAAAQKYATANHTDSTNIVTDLTNQRDSTVKSLEDQKKGYKDAATSVSVSVDQWEATLAKNVQDTTNWSINLVKLSGRVSSGTLTELAKMGTDGAPLIAKLVDASGAQMTEMERLFKVGTTTSVESTTNIIATSGPVLREVAATAGQATADGLATKLADGEITIAQIAAQYGVALAQGLNPILVALSQPQVAPQAAGATSISHTKLMAAGGPVVGAGTGTSDSVPIWGSHGEYVVNAASTSKHRGTLDHINADKYADGGFVQGSDVPAPRSTAPYSAPLNQPADSAMKFEHDVAAKWVDANSGGGEASIKAFIQAQSGKPYIWGGAGPEGFDCSGFTGAVYGLMTHKGGGAGQRYFTTLSDFHSLGFEDGPGGVYTIGVSPTHMVGRYGGLPFEAGHTPITAGPGSQDTSRFPRQYHIGSGPGLGSGSGSGGDGTAGYAGGSDLKAYAQEQLTARGWGGQFGALDYIFSHESGWNPNDVNPSSGAYGIPQANPSGGQGHPYALGDGKGQIDWGLQYIGGRYGDPNGAERFWQSHQWYDQGGLLPPGPSLVMNGTGQNETVRTAAQEAALGGRGDTINVYVSAGNVVGPGGIKQFAQTIADELADQSRRNGRPITTASVF